MLMMKKEDGRWLIDDLISDGEGNQSVIAMRTGIPKEISLQKSKKSL